MSIRRLELPGHVTPSDVVRGWPAASPLAVLWSAGGEGSRWTVLGMPRETVRVQAGEGPGALRAALDRVCEAADRAPLQSPGTPPLAGGWIGWMAYEAGGVIEPIAAGAPPEPGSTLLEFHHCPDAVVFDHEAGEWWGAGELDERVLAIGRPARAFEVSTLRSGMGRREYERAGSAAVEYIRAGDAYQVNLSHRLEGAFAGSARELFVRLAGAAAPWYGAYVEGDAPGGERHAILSVSPEEFIHFDGASRVVRTRPMKGTARAGGHRRLESSEKERAELAMIVDLMRNDLGRVCEFGSVVVRDPRRIEPHARGELLQATACVEGRVRGGLGVAEVLWRMFPGGSVTGAPKIRAMQIIGELEASPRGVYCGCVGYIGAGRAAFSVAIRTAVVRGRPAGANRDAIDGRFSYSVGAGIVADSDPAAEWRETIEKAGVLRAIARVEPGDEPGDEPPPVARDHAYRQRDSM